MDTLALKLAEILQITVDKAVELLPFIRQQFIWYKILQPLWIISIFIMVGAIVACIATGIEFFVDLNYGYTSSLDKSKKMFKWAVVLLALSILLLLISNALIYIMAPDFMLIKEFL